MIKKGLFICGLLFFIAGIGLGLYLVVSTSRALALDRFLPGQGVGMLIPPCNDVQVDFPRVITVDDTVAVTVTIFNHDVDACESVLSLQALDFDVSPQNTNASPLVSAGQKQTIGWLLKPRSPGDYTIEITDGSYVHFMGITVTTILGLHAWQAQLLSYIGTFLGPLTGFAWWYDRWKERKQKKNDDILVAHTKIHSQTNKRRRRKRVLLKGK